MKDKRRDAEKLFFSFIFGSLYLLILLPFFHFPHDMRGIAGGIYAGMFEMGLTFLLWLKALEKAKNVAKIANLIYLSPFLSLIFIHYIAGEQILISTLAGLPLIIAGIVIQNMGR